MCMEKAENPSAAGRGQTTQPGCCAAIDPPGDSIFRSFRRRAAAQTSSVEIYCGTVRGGPHVESFDLRSHIRRDLAPQHEGMMKIDLQQIPFRTRRSIW